MREILGKAKTIWELLNSSKYSIDFYQREYKWKKKQVADLLDDLTTSFLDDYQPQHNRKGVRDYGHYFLGSIIISNKNGNNYIVDGQQRLTTLTLLLIYLNNLQKENEETVNIQNLIFSEQYGERSFNIDVSERDLIMEALFTMQPFDEADQPESIQNIIQRYYDINELFPDELKEEALPYFINWLTYNVHLVEITAYADEDAYTIFETMNDRGLSLTSTDMLKGYLLANITSEETRWRMNDLWKQYLGALTEFDSHESGDFFKAWLRSQYADSIRERKRGAVPGDFDRIGSEFHRWVRDKRKRLGLNQSEDFQRFIEKDMVFYARRYIQIREASQSIISPFEEIYYIAQHGFTLQFFLLLAPLEPDDPDSVIQQKLRIVATYLDILLAQRLWNWRSISYSTMQYTMFRVMQDIRAQDPHQLVEILEERLDAEKERFTTNNKFSLHMMNGPHIHRLLARMTDYIEHQSGIPSHYAEYIGGTGSSRYEIEHIWANHFEWHTDEFSHPSDFRDVRNHIGGLLLLPKAFNASYGDLPYEDKVDHYFGQNLLAKSLHHKCYERNPGFLDFVESSGLPFQSHVQFRQADLDARQQLYMQLADQVWNPSRLRAILAE